jgi:hypothetical protein
MKDGVTMHSFYLGYDEEKQVLLAQFTGVITDSILLGRYQQMREWHDNHGLCGSISDFSGVTDFKVTGKAIRRLASNTPLVPANFLRVLVAPQDDIFGLARMFEMAGSAMGNRLDIVRNTDEAYKMAGITKPNFRSIEVPALPE